MTAPLNAAIAPNVPASRRATFFSIQSLFGRLGFSLTLAVFATAAGGEDWSAITKMLSWGMWGGLAGLLILLLTVGWLKNEAASQKS